MTKQEIRNYLNNCGLTVVDIEPYISIVGSRGKWQLKDIRTFKTDKGYHIYPLGFNRSQCLIACPFCGQIHFHGRCIDDNYQGHRVGHCRTGSPGGYIIEKLDSLTEKRLIKKSNNRILSRCKY